ncbi:SusC/RagA family TonB-linked outer membrane protein [Saccharicrinis aurantiacus]|uniref:SusC/RagA family TonB-linked outer membrane protein n=1 Tax=Saccharicrinis aurantiacus TaxID=1849719 RepID=UPI00083975F9|nr:SusC/RagA family TonB-linked outer membrane protein [Saccharicrinis aurantiacus]
MKHVLWAVLVFIPALLWAQESRTIKGKVMGIDGMPISGIAIYQNNKLINSASDINTVSDANGNFQLTISKSVIELRFSMVGFDDFDLQLGSQNYYEVIMEESFSLWDEVVVTGYQELKGKKITGAIAKVDLLDIEQKAVANVDQMLAGQINGVDVSTITGRPGSSPNITIRGNSTIQGNSQPLWVLDGMPLNSNEVPQMVGSDFDQLQYSSIGGIQPSDIESITVLKDASATAIYGARASNGVIVLTSKRGTKGDIRVNANTNWGVSMQPKYTNLNLLNANQKVDLELDFAGRTDLNSPLGRGEVARIIQNADEYELYQQQGFSGLSPESQSSINNLRNTNSGIYDELYQNALTQNHSMDISGGNEVTNYYFSVGYYNQDGTTKGTSFDRFNATLKTDFQVSSKLNIGVSLFTSKRNESSYLADFDSNTNPSRYIRTVNPYQQLKDDEGEYIYDKDILGYGGTQINYNVLEERSNTNYTQDIFTTHSIFDLKWDITSTVKFVSQIGLSNDRISDEYSAQEESYYALKQREGSRSGYAPNYTYALPEGGSIANNNNSFDQWNIKNMLQYSEEFGKHEIDLMIGSEQRKSTYNQIYSAAYGVNPKSLAAAPTTFNNAEEARKYPLYDKREITNAYSSFFATANYSYQNRYSVSGSIRYDESDLFGADEANKSLPIYSIGGVWHVTEETFMNNVNFLSSLNIRSSYGIQGNIDKNTYPFVIGRYNKTNVLPAFTEGTIEVVSPPNNELGWEKTTTWNVGIDMGVFNNRISAGLDIYNRNSTDLVSILGTPEEAGFSSRALNYAEMSNNGIELSLTTINIKTNNFSWQTGFNIYKNTNEVKDLFLDDNNLTPSLVGSSINTIYALPTNGVDAQGYPIFVKDGVDMNVKDFFQLQAQWDIATNVESGLSNDELRNLYTEVGTTTPEWSGGFNNNFNYKNWNLKIFTNFHINQWVKEQPFYSMTDFDIGVNTTNEILNIWSPSNPGSMYPGIVGPGMYEGDRDLDYYWMQGGSEEQNMNAFNDLDIWYKKISYLRISSIQLEYSIPSILCEKLTMSAVKLSFEARNPFVFGSNYDGYSDPETFGNTYSQPLTQSFMMGLNISF